MVVGVGVVVDDKRDDEEGEMSWGRSDAGPLGVALNPAVVWSD